MQQEDLTLSQIEKLEEILSESRSNSDTSWDQNEAVSKLLNVKFEFEDDIFKGTGGYEVGHAVYKLQKDCNITDLDTGLTHCQALHLRQTGQMWKFLKMLDTLSEETLRSAVYIEKFDSSNEKVEMTGAEFDEIKAGVFTAFWSESSDV